MTVTERMIEDRNSINATHRDEIKVLISMNDVRFSQNPGDYMEVTEDVFLSGLPYLLLFNRIPANSDLEVANSKAENVIVRMIEKEIRKLNFAMALHDLMAKDYYLIQKKISLLNKAILFLRSS